MIRTFRPPVLDKRPAPKLPFSGDGPLPGGGTLDYEEEVKDDFDKAPSTNSWQYYSPGVQSLYTDYLLTNTALW